MNAIRHFEKNPVNAIILDQQDPLKEFRKEFYIPKRNNTEVIYFCGNSLGLQPKITSSKIDHELKKWAQKGVEGHFNEDPWVSHHHKGKTAMAHLVGAKTHEVVAMNNLTTNLHLLLASFYQPKGTRKKMIIEKGAFPSDYFAVTSHMKQKGISPEDHLIEISPDENGYFSTEKICHSILTTGDALALVMLPGIQYYSGQFLDLKSITHAAHKVGAYAGFDLAHAVGNIPMTLHEDQVDFAAWCSYKYLNSGPGNVSGVFIHEKHGNNPDFPRLAGWWGQNETIRFKMENNFDPIPGIDGWMLSNANIISSVAHLASLDIFEKANIHELRKKSILLTGYLEYLLVNNAAIKPHINILTPKNESERGCQLSLYFYDQGRFAFDHLTKNGVVLDWREPNVIRVAPVPLYNTFEEVEKFVTLLGQVFD